MVAIQSMAIMHIPAGGLLQPFVVVVLESYSQPVHHLGVLALRTATSSPTCLMLLGTQFCSRATILANLFLDPTIPLYLPQLTRHL